MKKLLSLVIVSLLAMIYSSNIALAHPGRTDRNGGHTCKTNCSKWGLSYGQYHYHR